MTDLRFAILAASLSFTSACVRDVDLAATDAGATDAPTVDAPTVDAPTDAPPADAPSVPYCPVELDRNTPQNPALLYPRAVVTVPPGSSQTFPASTAQQIVGEWLPPRRLDAPLERGCVDAVATSPACHPDAVLRVRPSGDAEPVEYVVSVPFEELAAIPVNGGVVLSLTGFSDRLSEDAVVLRVTLLTGGPPLLVVAVGPAPDPAWVGVARVEPPTCVSRPEPLCRRTLAAYALRVPGFTPELEVAPLATAERTTPAGRYRVRHYGWTHRVPSGGTECADFTADRVSYEIVRLPDA